jgi:dihydroorotate dehydrogenase electron transfer subunit
MSAPGSALDARPVPPVDVHAEVLANTRLSSDYNLVLLGAPEIASRALPGQFVMVKASRGLDPLLRRPFSIFEIARDARGGLVGISLLNKRVGAGTGRLFEARVGDRLDCLGPLGRPFVPVDPPAESWLVAGGVGLAPFATLAEALRARGTQTTLFYGARRAADLYCTDVFERLGARLVLATEDGSRGERGLVSVPLERALASRPPAGPVHLYACGPTPMMRAVAGLASRYGCACSVSLEQVMGCGMGGCYSCVVRVREGEGPAHFVRSCLSGPVFDARAVVWEELATGH